MDIPIIDGVPFGNTSPVANCSKHFDVPIDIGMAYVDYLIHGTRPVSRVAHPITGVAPPMSDLAERVSRYVVNHIRPDECWNAFLEIAKRMPAYWDRRPGAKRP